MFPDIGLSEILVVAVVALLVGRPEDVPALMRKLGVTMAHLRHFVAGMWAGWQGSLTMDAPVEMGGREPVEDPQEAPEAPSHNLKQKTKSHGA